MGEDRQCEVLCAAADVVVSSVNGQLFIRNKATDLIAVTCAAVTPFKPDDCSKGDGDTTTPIAIVAVGTSQKVLHVLHVNGVDSDNIYTERARQ